jgi:inhibitor of KinA
VWDTLIKEKTPPPLKGKDVILPVLYKGEDLARVADYCGLTEEDVIDRHSRGRYTVAMVGFKPYFPYLLGLDPKLETPRLDTPRVKIPAGAVAIGGAQTGVYPEESPGGWNLIGSTDPELLKQIEPGDTILMKRVEL